MTKVHVNRHARNISGSMPKAPQFEEYTKPYVPASGGKSVLKVSLNGYTAEIESDPDPQNPRTEWDNMGHFASFHRNYQLGDKKPSEEFKSDPQGAEEQLKKEGAEILDVFLYDHSVLRLSSRDFTGRAQHAEWDSGKVGFIYATKEDIKKEFGSVTASTRAKARKILEQEIKTQDEYVSGEVYLIKTTTPKGETDYVGGFCGLDYAKTEALDMLKRAIKTPAKGQSKLV